MLIVLAASNANAATTKVHRGNFLRKAPARPCPVTIPIRAHIICTIAMKGQLMKAVQRRDVPS